MAEIDKQEHYGDFRDAAKRREKLYMKAVHKSLDLPEEMGDINANRTGIGALGAVLIALAAGLGPTVLGAYMLLREMKPASSSPAPADSEYDVRFFDKDGNPITIPQKK